MMTDQQQLILKEKFIEQTKKQIEELRQEVKYLGITVILYILIQTISNVIHGYYTTFPLAIIPGQIIRFTTLMHTISLTIPGVILLKHRYLLRNYIKTNYFSDLTEPAF